MAKKYTYEDFDKALKQSGLIDQFSAEDLELAQNDPDSGMAILSYKQDYNNATTDELRALAHAGAESVRASYKNAGAETVPSTSVSQPTPGSFSYTEPAPTYKNTYGEQIDNLMTEIMNREKFVYDPATDPLYSSYKKTYTREGKRATADVLGEAAAMTGGIPSSYAVTAASQAGNNYAAQLADKVPELYEMAYNKYLQDYNAKLDNLKLLQDREQFEYEQYLDEAAQHEKDKNFNYAQWLDEIDAQANARSEALQKAYAAAEYGDYSLLENLGITPDYEYLASLAAKNSGTSNDTDSPTAPTSIDAETLAVLKELYPDGKITNADDWNLLVEQFGENVLTAAGYVNAVSANASTLPPLTGAGLNFADRERVDTTGLIPVQNSEDVAVQMETSINTLLEKMIGNDPSIKSLEDVRNALLEQFPAYSKNTALKEELDALIAEIAKEKYGYTAPATKYPQSQTYTAPRSGLVGGKKIERIALS